MGLHPKKQLFIAVDTNVLMDEEGDVNDVLDALSVIRKKLPQAQFVVTETVLQELAFLAANAQKSADKILASGALEKFLMRGYIPLVISPLERGIATEIALKIQLAQLLPPEEINDATILAEVALKGCGILLTSDGHLLDMNDEWDSLCSILKESDTQSSEVAITSPRSLVRKYWIKS